jgi:hypothetical protein
MMSCWNTNPRQRPTFADLLLSLTNKPALAQRSLSDRGGHRHTSNHPEPAMRMQASKSHVFDSTSPQPVLDATEVRVQSQGKAITLPHTSRTVQHDVRSHSIPIDGMHHSHARHALPNTVHMNEYQQDRSLYRNSSNHAPAGLSSFVSFSQQHVLDMDDDQEDECSL